MYMYRGRERLTPLPGITVLSVVIIFRLPLLLDHCKHNSILLVATRKYQRFSIAKVLYVLKYVQ